MSIGGAIALAGLRGARDWRRLALTVPVGLLADAALSVIRL